MERSNRGLVRRPFESPRGRGRGNPGWRRENGLPFVSQRGRGRKIFARSNDSTHEEILSVDESSEEQPIGYPVQQLVAPDGRLYYTGLVRLDNKPFESPRGRGRNNLGSGRTDGIAFTFQSGRAPSPCPPSAPSWEDIMTVE